MAPACPHYSSEDACLTCLRAARDAARDHQQRETLRANRARELELVAEERCKDLKKQVQQLAVDVYLEAWERATGAILEQSSATERVDEFLTRRVLRASPKVAP